MTPEDRVIYCPSDNSQTLKDMGKIDQHRSLAKHKVARTVCIRLETDSTSRLNIETVFLSEDFHYEIVLSGMGFLL